MMFCLIFVEARKLEERARMLEQEIAEGDLGTDDYVEKELEISQMYNARNNQKHVFSRLKWSFW